MASVANKQWIEPALDGTGGGYGKFAGKSVKEIAQLFQTISEEANMRSVSAVLRITYEQLEGRSHLSSAPLAASIIGVVAVALAIPIPFVDEKFKVGLEKACGVAAALFVLFLTGAISTLKATKAAKAQTAAINELAVETLIGLVSQPEFESGALNSLQQQTLRQILAKTKRDSPELAKLAND